ncbi:hypothetical protein WKW79_22900 [Variovorax robiniae]|uniref:ATP-binding protein n=1 Tax=Variovorax robiniae TaxID=1836199 RepID=A0ABU8XCQ0_9BURK
MTLNHNQESKRAGESSADTPPPVGAANADVYTLGSKPMSMRLEGPSGLGKSQWLADEMQFLRQRSWARLFQELRTPRQDFALTRAGTMTLDVCTEGCSRDHKVIFIARSLKLTLEIPFHTARTRSAISAVQQAAAAFRGAQHKIETVEADQRLCSEVLTAHCRSLGLELKATAHRVPFVWVRV